MALAFPYDFATKTSVTGAELQAQFDAVGDVLDAGLTTAHISPTAGILSTQLAVSYEHMVVKLKYAGGAGWPAGGAAVYLDGAAIPGTTAEANWTCTGVSWCCTDIGAGTGTFMIDWARYTGGAWVTDLAVLNAATAVATPTGDAVLAGVATSLALPFNAAGGPSCLMLRDVGGADATMINAAPDFFSVTIRLARIITAGVI